jgi:hypothetical protein
VRADGVTHGVYDQDEFDRALAGGWLSDREARAASNELRSLVELINAGSLVKFLANICAFGPTTAPLAPRHAAGSLADVGAFFEPGVRPSW